MMRFVTTTVLAIGLGLAAVMPAAADKLPLNAISGYLNDLKTAKGEFTQINDDGSISTGTIYIKRPGKVRFEYNAPEYIEKSEFHFNSPNSIGGTLQSELTVQGEELSLVGTISRDGEKNQLKETWKRFEW